MPRKQQGRPSGRPCFSVPVKSLLVYWLCLGGNQQKQLGLLGQWLTPIRIKQSMPFEELQKIDLKVLDGKGLPPVVVDFLSSTGLPNSCSPLLSFLHCEEEKQLLPVTELYEYLDSSYSGSFMIGTTGNGDQIVIDANDLCSVKVLNHDFDFERDPMNSSITKLYESLVAYEEFVDSVIEKYGDDGYLDCLYSNEELNSLSKKLADIDPEPFSQGGFWKTEIDVQRLIKNETKD